MPKYLLIDSENIYIPSSGHGYFDENRSVPKLKWFNTEDELITYMETWGKNIKDPVIYELAGRVTLESKLSVSIKK